MQTTKIVAWGKSYAVRLSAKVLVRTGLKVGATIRITPTHRGLLIEPAMPRYRLDALLGAYDPAWHRHAEAEWDEDPGNEAI